MTFSPSPSTTDQALPDDLPPLPGIPFGILLVSTLGWLMVIIGTIALPWPLPGTPPTPIGSHLMHFATSIPDEALPAALIRHGLDVLPYAIIVIVPLCLVLASGWRRTRLAVRLLTVFGILGVLYAIGQALQFGPMVFIVGCILIAVSGWLGWSLPLVVMKPIHTASYEPMAVPSDRLDGAEDGEDRQPESAVLLSTESGLPDESAQFQQSEQ